MRKLVILEGPDGSGKTTFSGQLSKELKVDVTNHGPYTGESSIWEHYFNSMLPAYSGGRDVILDRCWLAEPIYGIVHRNGLNRITPWQLKLLHHTAHNCDTTVVWFLPPFDSCLTAFNSRRDVEMLDNSEQLRRVYDCYMLASMEQTKFRQVVYDHTRHSYAWARKSI